MMHLSQMLGVISTLKGFNEMRKMRNNPELKKARELMKQQEMQAEKII